MTLIDKIQKPVGHFKVEAFKDGILIDLFEEHNLIMKQSREHFMRMLSGMYADNKYINCIKLGTRGVYEYTENGKVMQNDAVPKDSEAGFNENLTDLFCKTDPATQGVNWEAITFSPSGSIDQTRANNIMDGSNNDSTVDIYIATDTEPTLTYVFNISSEAFNGPTGYIKFNEAGLYADDTLIAMRTFPSKGKDSETAFRITWTISF